MSTYFQPTDNPPQFQPCPLCAAPVPASARYPDAICAACVEEACDDAGRRIALGNTSGLGTGYAARCVETGELSESPRCWIRGVECRAAEAYFGGVVVRPAIAEVELRDIQRCSIGALLAAHARLLTELGTRGVLRSGNNPLGDYTEWLVATRLGLQLQDNSARGYDASGPDGQRYQIKGRRRGRGTAPLQLGVIRNLTASEFHVLAVVTYRADWSIEHALLVPHAIVASLATYRAHVHGHVLRVSPALTSHPQVEDIAARLQPSMSASPKVKGGES